MRYVYLMILFKITTRNRGGTEPISINIGLVNPFYQYYSVLDGPSDVGDPPLVAIATFHLQVHWPLSQNQNLSVDC